MNFHNTVKKTALALAIGSTLSAGQATAAMSSGTDVSVYGRMRAGLVCNDQEGVKDNCTLQNGSSRFGFKVSENLGNDLAVIGQYEFGVNLDEGGLAIKQGRSNKIVNNTNRVTTVGLKGGFGSFTIGAQWSPFYDWIAGPIDPSNMNNFAGEGQGLNLPFRKGDSALYSKTFNDDGTTGLGVMIVMDEETPSGMYSKDVDEIHLGGGVGLGPVDLGFGVWHAANIQTVYGLRVSGKAGIFGWGLGTTLTDPDDETNTAKELGVRIHLNFALGENNTINLGLSQAKKEHAGYDESASKIGLEFVSKISKNTRWFVGADRYDNNKLIMNNKRSDAVNMFVAGIRLDWSS